MKRHILRVGWRNTVTKFPGCRKIIISKVKAMRSSAATCFFAGTNFVPTSIPTEQSQTCSDVSSSQSNLSIRAFIISTPVFVRFPTAQQSGSQPRSMNMANTRSANTCPNLSMSARKKLFIFPVTPSFSNTKSFCRKARRSWWQLYAIAAITAMSCL